MIWQTGCRTTTTFSLKKKKRLAAENNYTLKEDELQEVESRLKEEYHCRIITETALKWTKRTVDNLRLSLKAPQKEREDGSRSAETLKELENVKKQLQEKTISNTELASKVKAQERTIEHFEWMVAELTVQIKSASETINHLPEITADGPKSSAAEKSPEPQCFHTNWGFCLKVSLNQRMSLSKLRLSGLKRSMKQRSYLPKLKLVDLKISLKKKRSPQKLRLL